MSVQEDSESWSPPDDDSGAAPVAEPAIDTTDADNSGAAPVAPPQGQQDDNPAGEGAVSPGQSKRLVSYIMGADGDPQAALQSAQAVKQQQPNLSDDDAALIALAEAAKTGDYGPAWKLLQGHRVAYNAKLAFAKVALEGIQGKPPNLASAVDAANKAMMHMPDGSNVQFTPSQNGVTATVKMPGTSQTQQIPMSVDQFKQFVDVGGSGQWDKVQARGVPATLSALARGQGPAKGQTDISKQIPLQRNRTEPQAPKTDDDEDTIPPVNPGPKTAQVHDVTDDAAFSPAPGKLRSWSPETNYGDELEARAEKMFGQTGSREKEAWMAEQEEKELARSNSIDVANAKARGALEVARQTGADKRGVAETNAGAKVKASENYSAAKVAAAQEHLKAAIQKDLQVNKRNSANLAARALFNKVNNGGLNSLNDHEKAIYQNFLDQVPDEAQAPTSVKTAPPPANTGRAVTTNPQDTKALAWANANPNDPRAAQIKKRLGAQ